MLTIPDPNQPITHARTQTVLLCAIARYLEAETGVWWGPMDIANGFWLAIGRQGQGCFVSWSQRQGLRSGGVPLANIARELGGICEDMVPVEALERALAAALRVTFGLFGGCGLVKREGRAVRCWLMRYSINNEQLTINKGN